MLGCVSESHAELCRVFVDSLPKENDGGRFGFIVAIRSVACASAWFRGEGRKLFFDLWSENSWPYTCHVVN